DLLEWLWMTVRALAPAAAPNRRGAARVYMGRPEGPGWSAAKSRQHFFGNRPGVQRLTRRCRPPHPGAHLEALRAEARADGDLVLHPEGLGLHPGDLRPYRQDIAVARRAQELRAGFDDGHADDVVLGKRLGPRQPERREQGLTAEVVPLEEARIENDAGRVDVAPADLHLRRVLDHH